MRERGVNEFTRSPRFLDISFSPSTFRFFQFQLSFPFLSLSLSVLFSQILEFVREIIASSFSTVFFRRSILHKNGKKRFVPRFQSSTCCSTRLERCAVPHPTETPESQRTFPSPSLPRFRHSPQSRSSRCIFPYGINVSPCQFYYTTLSSRYAGKEKR